MRCQRRSRNGLTVTYHEYNIRSSTHRLPAHLMVQAEVCGGQERARSTLDGREVDLTTDFEVNTQNTRFGVNKLFTAPVRLAAD